MNICKLISLPAFNFQEYKFIRKYFSMIKYVVNIETFCTLWDRLFIEKYFFLRVKVKKIIIIEKKLCHIQASLSPTQVMKKVILKVHFRSRWKSFKILFSDFLWKFFFTKIYRLESGQKICWVLTYHFVLINIKKSNNRSDTKSILKYTQNSTKWAPAEFF